MSNYAPEIPLCICDGSGQHSVICPKRTTTGRRQALHRSRTHTAVICACSHSDIWRQPRYKIRFGALGKPLLKPWFRVGRNSHVRTTGISCWAMSCTQSPECCWLNSRRVDTLGVPDLKWACSMAPSGHCEAVFLPPGQVGSIRRPGPCLEGYPMSYRAPPITGAFELVVLTCAPVLAFKW